MGRRALVLPATALALLLLPVARAANFAASDHGRPAADVVIVLDPLDATPPAATGHATIDQVAKRFVPRVTVIRTGVPAESLSRSRGRPVLTRSGAAGSAMGLPGAGSSSAARLKASAAAEGSPR